MGYQKLDFSQYLDADTDDEIKVAKVAKAANPANAVEQVKQNNGLEIATRGEFWRILANSAISEYGDADEAPVKVEPADDADVQKRAAIRKSDGGMTRAEAKRPAPNGGEVSR